MNSPEFVNQHEIHAELEDRRNNLEPITTGDDSYSEETPDQS